MGQNYSTNDYQMVVQCSIELEKLLKNKFGARGTGLGELCKSASIPQLTKAHIDYVRKERNKKVHKGKCIDRQKFIRNFEEARDGLRALAAARVENAKPPKSDGKDTSSSLSGGLILGGLLAAGAIAIAASKFEDRDHASESE